MRYDKHLSQKNDARILDPNIPLNRYDTASRRNRNYL